MTMKLEYGTKGNTFNIFSMPDSMCYMSEVEKKQQRRRPKNERNQDTAAVVETAASKIGLKNDYIDVGQQELLKIARKKLARFG